VLDSARFRHLLSTHCGVDARNVHAYVLGEHGDSEVPIWSMTNLAGMAMDDYCPACLKSSDWGHERTRIVTEVQNSVYHIIDAKGSTCFAIGLALVRIVGAILRDEHSVLLGKKHPLAADQIQETEKLVGRQLKRFEEVPQHPKPRSTDWLLEAIGQEEFRDSASRKSWTIRCWMATIMKRRYGDYHG